MAAKGAQACRVILALALLCVVPLAPSPAVAQAPEFTIIYLDGCAGCAPYAMNNAAQIVGDVDGRAFLWQTGTRIDIGTPGTDTSIALDINQGGQVVGYGATYLNEEPWYYIRPFLWQNGVMRDLGTLGGDYGLAVGINDRGVVVGHSSDANGHTYATAWAGGRAVKLYSEKCPAYEAYGINNRGEVIGWSDVMSVAGHAILCRKGGYVDLTPAATWSQPNAINDRSQVVGIYFDMEMNSRAFLWSGGLTTDLGLLPGVEFTQAYDINERGQVVGQSGQRPFIWQDGNMTELTPEGCSYGEARAINDSGKIVGWVQCAQGTRELVMWQPVE